MCPKVNNPNTDTPPEENNGKWYRFFGKWTIIGIILVLISIIIDMVSADYLDSTTQAFLMKGAAIISQLFQTVGVALIIGAIFDFSKKFKRFYRICF